ncbi:MAG: hypothetical protein ACI88L_000215 [Candidatus Paceibacteria bacterium]|jgi:hypothetical protein
MNHKTKIIISAVSLTIIALLVIFMVRINNQKADEFGLTNKQKREALEFFASSQPTEPITEEQKQEALEFFASSQPTEPITEEQRQESLEFFNKQ